MLPNLSNLEIYKPKDADATAATATLTSPTVFYQPVEMAMDHMPAPVGETMDRSGSSEAVKFTTENKNTVLLEANLNYSGTHRATMPVLVTGFDNFTIFKPGSDEIKYGFGPLCCLDVATLERSDGSLKHSRWIHTTAVRFPLNICCGGFLAKYTVVSGPVNSDGTPSSKVEFLSQHDCHPRCCGCVPNCCACCPSTYPCWLAPSFGCLFSAMGCLQRGECFVCWPCAWCLLCVAKSWPGTCCPCCHPCCRS